jgi:hypothetical protein
MTRSEFGSVAFELKTVAEFAPADFSERFVALRMSSGSNVSGHFLQTIPKFSALLVMLDLRHTGERICTPT